MIKQYPRLVVRKVRPERFTVRGERFIGVRDDGLDWEVRRVHGQWQAPSQGLAIYRTQTMEDAHKLATEMVERERARSLPSAQSEEPATIYAGSNDPTVEIPLARYEKYAL